MDYNNDFEIKEVARGTDMPVASALPALMRKVYVWMTLALVITGFTAYAVATSPALLMAIVGNRFVLLGLIVAELALVVGISGAINRLSLTAATLMFVLYSVINGATLSVVFLAFTMSSITSVFFITAGTFATMALVGYTTKKDLTSMGRMLFMALIGLVIATVVNMFMRNSGLDMILNYVGVLVFVGLTAYDTQKIKEQLMMAGDAGEAWQKMALVGALTLYLDFINLFLYLLRILGKRE
ncbi:Bax inhibitor-1/YccA family protein [Marseilla massiliensis]|jgi:FtsH-binding integral membrane protein|uniref:Bax inhibitor-1/YccA family protein n=1 Tax=Marseilla massiliensis TaxID=1841864 RepID=UPI001F865617|nr:Bax inhibitor-1/YccA family protein [Marseilla massiliensis]MCL1611595.1 Bax inhibitor-1/YccA family protein [Marseilla massiliensis]MEE0360705.1 Bax inhibitor-1/YccA family protein [Prevotella sp.]HIV83104.1 Bax inhibitor-1/YccA family protein [Candidatus Prevotella intestinigallinarum]